MATRLVVIPRTTPIDVRKPNADCGAARMAHALGGRTVTPIGNPEKEVPSGRTYRPRPYHPAACDQLVDADRSHDLLGRYRRRLHLVRFPVVLCRKGSSSTKTAPCPRGLAKAYDGSFLASVPGLNAAWLLLGLLEAVAFIVVIASLATGEFVWARRMPPLLASMAVSMLTFAVMAFAQNMIADHASVASLFTYMGVAAVVFALIHLVPPFRGTQAD